MSKLSFPLRGKIRRRTPLTPAQHDNRIRLLLAALIVGVGAVFAHAFRDVPVAALLWALLAVAAAFVVADPGNGLLATVAPKPDVHTEPVTGADLVTEVSTMRIDVIPPPAGARADHETAVAEAVGVYRRPGAHSHRALVEAQLPTTAIPAVKA